MFSLRKSQRQLHCGKSTGQIRMCGERALLLLLERQEHARSLLMHARMLLVHACDCML
jgi:hypothetical protein